MRRDRKRYWRRTGIAALVVMLTAGGLGYFGMMRQNRQKIRPENADMEIVAGEGEGIITATGVTKIGADTVTFAIDFLEDTRLCVEDVYLSAGDTAAAGEPFIKFTNESIQKARAELERAVQRTDLAYRNRVISAGEEKIQAKYTYDTAVLEAEHAPQVYQDALTRLEMQLAKAEQDCERAQEAYSAYYRAVENDTFREDYQIEALRKAYEDAYDLCAQRSKYYAVTQEERSQLSGNKDQVQNDRQWILQSIALLQEEAAEAKQEYEQAKQAYQQEIEGAELKLQKLLNQYEQAQQCLADAQIAQQKGSIQAETLYELTVAKGQTAKSDHDVFLITLAEEIEQQKEARDEAVSNRELFEESVGDGYLYTERAGTVAKIYAEAGQEIAGGSLILAYSDPGEQFVSVTLPEAEQLSVGAAAAISIEGYGSIDGVVTAIQPVTVPGIGTAVCSLVIIAPRDGAGAFDPGLTATVTFGDIAHDDTVQCSAGAYQTRQGDQAHPMYGLDIGGQDIFAGTDGAYLTIEEICVAAGQHINARDTVCRFSQDSAANVRKMLTRAQTDAHRTLMKAQTDYHIEVLSAGLAHNEALLDTALAQTVYDNALAELNTEKVAKLLEIETLLTEIYQLQTALTDDDHQRRRAEITRAYDRAKQQVEKARERFVTSQVDAAQDFQAARESYEAFLGQLEDSSRQITEKAEKIYALQKEILQDQQLLERKLLAAEQARSRAEAEGESAGARYESIVKEKERAVRSAQSDLEQAARRLEDFDRFVGDGTLYAAESGMVAAVGYREGDRLVDAEKLLTLVADEDADSPIGEGGREDSQ